MHKKTHFFNKQCFTIAPCITRVSIMTLHTFYHIHERKLLVFLSTQCGLHNSAGKSIAVEDSQSSRRRARGNSKASIPSGPNDTELALAKQTPSLHWQIRTFTVCKSPLPCRSVTITSTSCIPVGISLS